MTDDPATTGGGADRPLLLVAYDGTSTSPFELADELAGLCDLAWLVDRADPTLGPLARLLPRYGPVIDRAGRTEAEVVAEARALAVDGVIAFSDGQLATAAAVARALGLPANPPEVVEALTDKVAQRARLADGGIAGPRTARLAAGTTPDRAAEACDWDLGACVVKPCRGTGSRDTWRADGRTGLLAGLQRVAGPDGTLPEDLIVEEWLDGDPGQTADGLADYVSVEAMAVGGRVTPLAITGKFPLAAPCRETGNFLPHNLDGPAAAAVRDLAVAAPGALGVRTGALHIEIKLTPDGPRVIEVNGRVAGGAIDRLLADELGTTLTRLAAAAAVGRPIAVEAFVPRAEAGPFRAAWFLQAPAGARRLAAAGGLERLAAHPWVDATTWNRTVGDALDWRDGSQGYVVSVLATVPDVGALASLPTALAGLLELSFDDADGAADAP